MEVHPHKFDLSPVRQLPSCFLPQFSLRENKPVYKRGGLRKHILRCADEFTAQIVVRGKNFFFFKKKKIPSHTFSSIVHHHRISSNARKAPRRSGNFSSVIPPTFCRPPPSSPRYRQKLLEERGGSRIYIFFCCCESVGSLIREGARKKELSTRAFCHTAKP